jgi:alpha-1,6-mannosyltransferase
VTRGALLPVLVALGLRLAAILAFDGSVADVARYERVARHLLDRSWNPYATERLYPYPPPWAAVEAAALGLARAGIGSFAVNVKLPVLAADLGIVALLARAAGLGLAAPGAAWLYALHPVSLLVTGAHGQFDAIPLGFLLLAVLFAERGRPAASALALGAGIATKSFPVLALPFLAFAGGASPRAAIRYAATALLPCALLLAPFAVADAAGLRRELFAYGGIADFGWAGVARGVEWLLTGVLPRSEALLWPAAAAASKLAFLAGWAAIALAARARRLELAPRRGVLAALLAFAVLYGLQSAQYLLWLVPVALLRPERAAAAHAAAATVGLVGFYLFLAPGVLHSPLEGSALQTAGCLWLLGSVATLVVCALWLARLLLDAAPGALRREVRGV